MGILFDFDRPQGEVIRAYAGLHRLTRCKDMKEVSATIFVYRSKAAKDSGKEPESSRLELIRGPEFDINYPSDYTGTENEYQRAWNVIKTREFYQNFEDEI